MCNGNDEKVVSVTMTMTPEMEHYLEVRMAMALIEHLYNEGKICKKTYEASMNEAKKMLE